MREYKSSGIAPFPGILTALVYGLIAAAIVGGILFAIDHYIGFYLIIMFPVVAGFIVSFVLTLGITAGKIRNGAVAFLIGAICGLATMGMYHFLNYQIGFKTDEKNAIAQPGSSVTDQEEQLSEAAFLTQEVKQTGFTGFLMYQAKQGITITRSTSSSGINLVGGWAWGYFGIEVLVVAFIAGGVASSTANDPFDERSNAWYGKPVHVLSASFGQAPAIRDALKNASFGAAGQLMTRAALAAPRLDLTARSTADGHPESIVLELNEITLDGKKNAKTRKLEQGMVTQLELEQIMASAAGQLVVAATNDGLATAG